MVYVRDAALIPGRERSVSVRLSGASERQLQARGLDSLVVIPWTWTRRHSLGVGRQDLQQRTLIVLGALIARDKVLTAAPAQLIAVLSANGDHLVHAHHACGEETRLLTL